MIGGKIIVGPYQQLPWSELVKFLDGTYASLSFAFEEQGGGSGFYRIVTESFGGLHREAVINRDGSEASDVSDFETNYKGLNPPPSGGSTLIAPITMQNAATATGGGTPLLVAGYNTATVVVSGTFSATISWQASIDGGSTWSAIRAVNHGTGNVLSTTTNTGIFVLSTPSYTHVRANITSYTSGSITAVGVASNTAQRVSNLEALIAGTDSNNVPRQILTTTDGRLAIAAAISPPINTTPVNQQYVGDVSSTTDSFYIIPTGKSVRIQRFSAGSEADATAGSKCELYYAPNGNTTGIVQIGIPIYTNGDTFELGLDYEAPDVGDGTRAIMVRRQRFSGGAVEIAAFWDGYY